MIDADVQNLDLINEALHEFTKPEARAVQVIDLQDESLSPAFRRAGLSIESINQALASYLNRQEIQQLLSEFRKSVTNPSGPSSELLQKLTPKILESTSPAEKRELLSILLDKDPSAEACAKALLILEQIDYGARLNSSSRASFFNEDMSSLAKLFSLSPTHEQANTLANSLIRERLERLARGLPDARLREYFLNTNRSAAELIDVLKHVDSQQRIGFVTELFTHGGNNSEMIEFLADKLDNVGHLLTSEEKSRVLRFLIDTHPSEQAASLSCKVLRGCENLSELVQVIAGTGENRLLALRNRDLNEYLALAKLAPQIRQVEFPLRPDRNLNSEVLEGYREQFEAALEQIRSICESVDVYRNSRVARDYLQTLDDNLSQLDSKLSQFRTGQSGSEISVLNSMLDEIERCCTEAQIEFRYGVSLTQGNSDYLDRNDQHAIPAEEFGIDLSQLSREPLGINTNADWSLVDLRHIEDVLRRIPEGDVLFSDLFTTIERVSSLGWGVLGARYPGSGVIKIASLTIDNQQIADQYQGINSLKIVLAHEIGHALQIGDGPGGIYFPDHTDPYFGSGEEVHDFDEWINLSGWKAYDRARISPGERPGTVKVDGVELPLATPVELDGCKVILQYNPGWNLLTSYNADADFSSRWYAKTSPWEDFAEAFSEYLYLPERLIHDAPHKFKHLEQEFKRYEDNRELEQQLEHSLARKRMLESGSAESSSISSNLQKDFWVI